MYDFDSLQDYLKAHLPGFRGPLEWRKFSDGQSNPTFQLFTPDATYVLRAKPLGNLLKSAHAVDREFRVQKALAATDVPVAPMHLLCEDEDVFGAAFYLMDHVQGDIHFDPRLSLVAKSKKHTYFRDMCRVLAGIHSVDLQTTNLTDYGAPGNYIARQVSRWSKQYRASETHEIPDMNRLIAKLEELVSDGFGEGLRSLVHGDYRIDNLIFSPSGKVQAVLDWELSTVGHPFADLASVIMQWRMPTGDIGRGLDGVDRDQEGIVSDEDFIATYCDLMNISEIMNFGIFLAFCFFRMGAVLQGVKKRALDGNASNPSHGLRMGEFVPHFAQNGLAALKDA